MQYFSKSDLPQAYRFYAVSLSILLSMGNALSAQNCLYRPTRLSAADPLCTKLTTLATRTNKALSVTKLANASKVINLSLDSIVTEMNLWATDSNRIVFLDDIMDVSSPFHLGNHIDSINVRMVRGWKMIYDSIGSSTIFKKDIQVLRSLDTILMTPTKLSAFTRNGKNLGTFLNKYSKTRCNLSGSAGLAGVPMMHEVLLNTAKVYERYSNIVYYTTFHDREVFASDRTFKDTLDDGTIRPKIAPSLGQDGAQHMIKYMVDFLMVRVADTIDGEIWPVGTNLSNCQADLFFRTPNLRFIEFKSYEPTTSLAKAKNVMQLKCYLSRIDSISQLRYVLNAKKTTLTQAQEKVQAMLKGTFGVEVFDVIWSNNALRLSLFPGLANTTQNKTAAKGLFDGWVTAFDNRIFLMVQIN